MYKRQLQTLRAAAAGAPILTIAKEIGVGSKVDKSIKAQKAQRVIETVVLKSNSKSLKLSERAGPQNKGRDSQVILIIPVVTDSPSRPEVSLNKSFTKSRLEGFFTVTD